MKEQGIFFLFRERIAKEKKKIIVIGVNVGELLLLHTIFMNISSNLFLKERKFSHSLHSAAISLISPPFFFFILNVITRPEVPKSCVSFLSLFRFSV